jgi:predicted deacylase
VGGNLDMKVGSAISTAGQITIGDLILGEYPDGAPANSPIAIACGMASGPVLWVQACIHGTEIGGIIGMQRVLGRLDLGSLKGAIVCVAICNPFGFRSYQRLTPQDGRNLNRVFPGNHSGDVTEQIAHRLFSAANDVADAVIDLHSGGDYAIACDYVIYRDDGSQAGKASARLARSVGAAKLWNAPPETFAGAAYLEFVRRGKPALLYESGGGSRVTERDIDNFDNAITGCCKALGMVASSATEPRAQFLHGGRSANFRAARGGIFVSSVSEGDLRSKGEEVGYVIGTFGERFENIQCPFDKAWVASIRRPYMPVFAGDELASLIEVSAVAP